MSFFKSTGGIFLLYELQNHDLGKGNTLAVRYYESYEQLTINIFLYEYQLQRKVDWISVKNIGTPSIEEIKPVVLLDNPEIRKFKNIYKLHY